MGEGADLIGVEYIVAEIYGCEGCKLEEGVYVGHAVVGQ